VESKQWYMSKTLWANVLMFVLAMLNSDLILSLNWLTPEQVAGVIGVVNIILRFFTSQPIASS
jgi:hypothetical protein